MEKKVHPYPPESYKIKVIEPIRLLDREERIEKIKRAGYSVFGLRGEDVYIDLLTDSGTNAMSDAQWSGLMMGDESYAGSRNFYDLKMAVHDVLGFDRVMPAHQGRGAEKVLYGLFVKGDSVVPNNMHFDTTRSWIKALGGNPVDLVIDEAYDIHSKHPFKGNIDISKLENLIESVGPESIPLVIMTLTNNTGGGQPVSINNISKVNDLISQYGIPLSLDICRFSDNAYFIKERESGYQDKSVAEIVLEMMEPADHCMMSCKKDCIVNIGGFIATRSAKIYERAASSLVLNEGFPTYGGLAGRDLEAMAIGLRETLNEDYLKARIGQVRYLGEKLIEGGVPVMEPIGGHAVYLDAYDMLPHIPRNQFPADSFAIALYMESGIRACGLGALAFHKVNETGEPIYPKLELIRLAIPRRVYTRSHMDYVAESVISLYERRDTIRGLRATYEPEIMSLRHFLGKFELV